MDKDLGRGENRQNPEEKQGDKIRQQPVLGKQNDDRKTQARNRIIQKRVRQLFARRQMPGESAWKHMAAVVQPDHTFGAKGVQNNV